MQNEPNFPRFSPKNRDPAKKQTQFKANSNPKQSQIYLGDAQRRRLSTIAVWFGSA
jgi:hypothetical protein